MRYIGTVRFALGTLEGDDLHGWVEPGEVVELPPRVAGRLLQEPERLWEPATKADLKEAE